MYREAGAGLSGCTEPAVTTCGKHGVWGAGNAIMPLTLRSVSGSFCRVLQGPGGLGENLCPSVDTCPLNPAGRRLESRHTEWRKTRPQSRTVRAQPLALARASLPLEVLSSLCGCPPRGKAKKSKRCLLSRDRARAIASRGAQPGPGPSALCVDSQGLPVPGARGSPQEQRVHRHRRPRAGRRAGRC